MDYKPKIEEFFRKQSDPRSAINDLEKNKHPELPPYDSPADFFLLLLRERAFWQWHTTAASALQGLCIEPMSPEIYEELCRFSVEALAFDADILSRSIRAIGSTKEGRAFLARKAVDWIVLGLDEWAQEAQHCVNRD